MLFAAKFMKHDREDILRTLAEKQQIIRGYGVRRLGLFGSCARGKPTDSSDLDFVVEFDHKSFDAYMDLKMFPEGLFGCKVDLVLTNAIKPGLSAVILSETAYAPGL